MHNIVKNLLEIENNIKAQINKLNITNHPKIIAVSKTFKIDKILPLIEHGHINYGENKVQEAVDKWTEIKKTNSKLKLHMIGKLQTNKVKKALEIFDYIHSLDSQKLADILSKIQLNTNKSIGYFIQVNLGNELQKSGIPTNEVEQFYNYCKEENKLKILGLMIIPPNDGNTKKYFQTLNELNKSLSLNELSMGMSADYIDAVKYNSTFVRIGSSIFGDRN